MLLVPFDEEIVMNIVKIIVLAILTNVAILNAKNPANLKVLEAWVNVPGLAPIDRTELLQGYVDIALLENDKWGDEEHGKQCTLYIPKKIPEISKYSFSILVGNYTCGDGEPIPFQTTDFLNLDCSKESSDINLAPLSSLMNFFGKMFIKSPDTSNKIDYGQTLLQSNKKRI